MAGNWFSRNRPTIASPPRGCWFALLVGMHPEAQRLNELSEQIIGAAIDVHRALGPGLLEAPYEECLCHELQKSLPLLYGDVKLPCAYRLDLVVEASIVVEIKSVSRWERVHEAQMISYLKLSGLHLGLVLNFNVKNLSHEGVMRKVNDFPG
jgi:GxxExxY protein